MCMHIYANKTADKLHIYVQKAKIVNNHKNECSKLRN